MMTPFTESVFMLEQAGFEAEAVDRVKKLSNNRYRLHSFSSEKIVMKRPIISMPEGGVWHFGIVAVEIDSHGSYWGVWSPVTDAGSET